MTHIRQGKNLYTIHKALERIRIEAKVHDREEKVHDRGKNLYTSREENVHD